MKQLKIRLVKYIILILFMINFSLLSNVEPVMAVEAEEEDNFTTMPNYRWHNETETSATVDEHLEQDLYVIDSVNNETTGSLDFAKSRSLNSRDFYFESRFQMDIGGSQVEYFKDVLGNPCDFDEGDIIFIDIATHATSELLDGFVQITGDDTSPWMSWGYYDFIPDLSVAVYHTVEYRVHVDRSGLSTYFKFYHDGGKVTYGAVDLDEGWNIVEWDIRDYYSTIDSFSYLYILGDDDLVAVATFDYVRLYGNLDYATHVEDEIEDTWDWEDSKEYWYDVEDNVSDFDDGSMEVWVGIDDTEVNWASGGVLYVWPWPSASGWLNITSTGNSIAAATYRHFAGEFVVDFDALENITDIYFYDSADNEIFHWDTVIEEQELVYGEFNGDWSGTETELTICMKMSDTLLNYVEINMTYLYDTELGDIEGTTGLTRQYVNPEGYLIGNMAASSYVIYSIPCSDADIIDNFDYIIVKGRAHTNTINIKAKFVFHDYSSSGEFPLTRYFDVSVWNTEFWDVSEWSNYKDAGKNVKSIQLVLRDDSGNFEGDEFIDIDYILFLGHWSETDGFKYSLLTEDHEEGMSFQFTNPNGITGQYNMNIDMFDSVGVALSYDYQFNYTENDGWLYLDVEWHLDKKKIKILFEYENRTIIVKTRSIYELFGPTSRERLILLEKGFPRLCMNNTIGSLAKSMFVIDYIDADWRLLDWQEPLGTYTPINVNYHAAQTQDDRNNFDSINPYGCSLYNRSVTEKSHYYQLSITRFDGIAFEVAIETLGLDAPDVYDYAMFVASLWNIQPNGTKIPALELELHIHGGAGGNNGKFRLFNGTEIVDMVFQQTFFPTNNIKAKISMFMSNSDLIVLQSESVGSGSTARRTIEREGNWTSEWVLNFMYVVKTSLDGATDDIINIGITGFEIARKDWIRDIVVAVLSPLIGIFMLVLTPFILLFNGLMLILIKSFSMLLDGIVSGLGSLLGVLGTTISLAIGGIAAAIWDLIGSVLGTINSTLAGLVGTLFEALWLLSSELSTLLEIIILILIVSLTIFLEDLFIQLSLFMDFFVNDFLIPIFAAIIASLGLTELFDFIGTWLEGIVSIIVPLIQLMFALWGYIWAAAAFWMVPARFQAAAMVIFFIIVTWIYYPVVNMFIDFATGNMDFDRTTGYFETILSHTGSVIGFSYTILTFMVDIFIKLINVIANFIPFT